MATTTLATMRTNIRAVTDENDTTFITDAMLLVWINAAIEELYDLVVAAFQDHYLTSADFTLTGGSEANSRAVIATYKYVRRVVRSPDTPQRRVCKRWELGEVYHQDVPGYRLMGSYIVIEPYESAAGTYRVWYVPAVTLLALDGDAISGLVDQWVDYILWRCAIKCALRAEKDTSEYQRELEAAKARVVQMAAMRDAGNPPVVNEVIPEWPAGATVGGGS